MGSQTSFPLQVDVTENPSDRAMKGLMICCLSLSAASEPLSSSVFQSLR